MTEYFLDFNDQNKSKTRIIFGVLFVFLSIGNGIVSTIDSSNGFGCLNTSLFFLLGIFHIIDGFGSSLKNILGRRFIKINDKHASFKYNFFSEAIELEWKNVKSIIIRFNSLEFVAKKNQKRAISLSKLNYGQKKEIKEYLISLTNKLNLKIN